MIYIESGYEGETYNLNHPRILWNSVTRRGTVTVSSEDTGYEGTNAATATTYDRWKPSTLNATWDLEFDSAETVSAVAIDYHTIGSTDTQVQVMEDDGLGGWENILPQQTPTDDSPIAFLFEARSLEKLRVRLVGSTPPEIGVIHICEAIEVQRRVYAGAATPIDMALVTDYRNTQSAKGQYLGRSIRNQKNENTFTVEHLTEEWVRDNLFEFIKDAREYPYFLLERPQDIPTALSYRWRDSDITPQRMGTKDWMQVDL